MTNRIIIQIGILCMFSQYCIGQFTPSNVFSVENICYPMKLFPLDYDLDGDIDILQFESYDWYDRWYKIFYNDGQGVFTEYVLGHGYLDPSVNHLLKLKGEIVGVDQIKPVGYYNGNLYYQPGGFDWGFSVMELPINEWSPNPDDLAYEVENELGYDRLYDFDSDGDVDVAVIEIATGNKKWLVNDGNLFGSPTDIPTYIYVDRNEEVYETTYDLNDDGLMDIVEWDLSTSQFVWRQGMSGNAFAPLQVLIDDALMSGEINWMLKDITGDGIKDFIASSYINGVYFAQGSANAGFESLQVWNDSNTIIPDYFGFLSVWPTDYDQDGDLDLWIENSPYVTQEERFIMLNSGGGNFEDPVQLDLDYYFGSGIAADFNGDGLLDLCSIGDTRTPGSRITIQMDFELNSNSSAVGYGTVYPGDATPFDYNSDGVMDLAFHEPLQNSFNSPNMVVLNAFTENPGPAIITEEDYTGWYSVNMDETLEHEWLRPEIYGMDYLMGFTHAFVNSANELVEVRHIDLEGSIVNGCWGIDDLNGDGLDEFWYYWADENYMNPQFNILSSNGDFSILGEPLMFTQSVAGVCDLDEDGFMEIYFYEWDGEVTYFIECNASFEWSDPMLFWQEPIDIRGVIRDRVSDTDYVLGIEDNLPYVSGLPIDLMIYELDDNGQIVDAMFGEAEVWFPEVVSYFQDWDIDSDGNESNDLFCISVSEGKFLSIWNGVPQVVDLGNVDTTGLWTWGPYIGSNRTFVGDLNGDNREDFCYYMGWDVMTWINTIGDGCGDPSACNYESNVNHVESMCCYGTCGCNDSAAINFDPNADCDDGSCQLSVSGRVFHDVSSNGIFDDGDYGLAYQTVTTSDGVSTFITNDQGYFTATTGNNNVLLLHTYDPSFPYYTTPSFHQTNLPGGAYVDFGLSMNEPLEELDVNIYHQWYLCDTDVLFYVCYRNLGNTVLNGQVEFTYDPLIMGYTPVSPITSVDGTTLTFEFVDLMPGQIQMKEVILETPDVSFLGTPMSFTLNVSGYNGSTLSAWGNETYERIHSCSYDPNDIQATPEGYTEAHFIEDGTVIEYLVRFQNTGNAPALNVRIDNTIDENLDLSSFQFIANSHDVSVAINNETREIQFFFDEIMLPDSTTNAEESQGFLSYRIAIAQPLETGTEINNTASIYFDNNPAVVTNTTWHTIYNCEEFDVQLNADESQWCATQTATVNAILPWADTYMWSVNGELMSELDDLQITEPGEKQITLVVDNPLCGVFEESITLNLEEVQMQSIQASATSVCEGETVDLSAVATSDSYIWSSTGNTLSTDNAITIATSGTYALTTTFGTCEQTNSINIAVTPLPEANITQSVNLLSTQTNANWTYQWYLNDELIVGATSSTYEIEASGMYQVVVTNGACEQSAEINASYISVEENTDSSWSWYPNPVVDELILICTAEQMDHQLEVLDVSGRVVSSIRINQNQLRIDTSNWSSGVYTIRTGDGTNVGRVIKK
jgi:uncharacterized repeat protein (TIGR01451 family)